eukprot:TRINITY_DN10015_c0_g1_i1.p1 TRINITY_DN10015_c0_g1~~TRINITY_DN10015_c0_g1_i1.p1  ORF type:complete len:409 (-),score=92.00 TRINITY_DN10015_c0_g1_i1:255-1481(-)
MATLQVKLTTQLPPPWVVPKKAVELPSAIKAAGLNKVLSQLLQNDEEAEFKFLVNGEFLQDAETIAAFLKERELDLEAGVEIEYVKATPAPEEGTTREHDDWISSVCTWQDGMALTGSYDGIARIWKGEELVTALSGHQGAIKSVVCYETARGRAVATASKDHTLRIWQLNDQMEVEALALCAGHTGSVEAVAVSEDGVICSGSWDHQIKLWNGDCATTAIPQQPKKKRKAPIEAAAEADCSATLEGHSDAVTALTWLDRFTFVSGGFDRNLRAWDASAETCVRVVNFNKAIRAVSWSESAQLLATAQGDKTVALFDMKGEGHLKVRLGQGGGHQEPVVDVAWMPGSTSLLASVSHDKTSLLWDIRSPKEPVHTLTTHDDKVLCAHWTNSQIVLTGGADCKLRQAMMS